LAKCAHCGLTFIGTAWATRSGTPQIHYVCNGKHQGRAIFGDKVGKCSAKSINGDLEDRVWKDIERFLRNPGEVLLELKAQSRGHELELRRSVGEVQGLRQALEAKAGEHDRILGLYRRGRIDDTALDAQLDQIEQEKAQLRGRIRELEAGANGAQTAQRRLESTETLLQELAGRLDQPMTWEVKRQLVEFMVAGIRVETKIFDGVPEAEATISYCFGLPSIAVDNRNHVAVDGSGIRSAVVAARRPRSRSIMRE
jgi:site-specific DNA recombinase